AFLGRSVTKFLVSLAALTGAVLLLTGALRWRQATLSDIAKHISWSIFGFIAGMFIVVRAVEETNLATLFGQLLLHLSGGGSFGAVMVGTAGAALGTNLINNVPMAVVLTSALQGVQHTSTTTRLGFSAATI